MKKIIICTLYILSFILYPLTFTSCVDPETPKVRYTAAAWLRVEKSVGSFVTDDGSTLLPTSTLPTDESVKDKRFLVQYTIESEQDKVYKVDLKNMIEMDTTSVSFTDEENLLASFKNDVVYPQLIWCSGDYINCYLCVQGSESKKHYLYLVDDGEQRSDTVALYLRFNGNKDYSGSVITYAQSFNVEDYLKRCNKDSVVFELNVNVADYGQTKAFLKSATKK